MTAKSVWNSPCSRTSGGFPVIATLAGVSSCFAEALLKKHFAAGVSIELVFAGLQAVPLAIVVRYFAIRVRRRRGGVGTIAASKQRGAISI